MVKRLLEGIGGWIGWWLLVDGYMVDSPPLPSVLRVSVVESMVGGDLEFDSNFVLRICPKAGDGRML